MKRLVWLLFLIGVALVACFLQSQVIMERRLATDHCAHCRKFYGHGSTIRPHWFGFNHVSATTPLCEECWEKLTPEQRWKYTDLKLTAYKQKWGYDFFSPLGGGYDKMKEAMLRGPPEDLDVPPRMSLEITKEEE